MTIDNILENEIYALMVKVRDRTASLRESIPVMPRHKLQKLNRITGMVSAMQDVILNQDVEII